MAAIEPITEFFAANARYPGNNKQWWVARAEVDDADKGIGAGDFLPEILDKLYSGNNRAPRGHYLLNAFYKDRSAVSGVTGIPVEETDERPTSVTFFSGRVWYACNSTVYFSQVLSERYKAGLCYQEADPTSEDISDLIATDGGVVPIPEAGKIVKILPNAGGILVFAINGVWNITGTQSGFSAQDISVNKISPIGCNSPMSVVETDAAVYWWSDVGIMGATQSNGMYGPIPGAFEKTNISEETIQSFYDAIPEDIRREVKGVYDPKANNIYWLYRDEDVSSKQYNRILVFDVALAAFYPWKIGSIDNGPRLKGITVSNRLNAVDTSQFDIRPSSLELTALKGENLRICQFRNTTFVDWKGEDDVGVPYYSYVETGYELFNDAMRKKAITYLFTYMRKTESEVTSDELIDTSSCWMQIKWDWSSGEIAKKWTTPVQIYRLSRFFLPENNEYNTGYPIVVTKNKVRGNGKAIQFRFGTDEPGRDFDLHGWSVAVTGNTVA